MTSQGVFLMSIEVQLIFPIQRLVNKKLKSKGMNVISELNS